MTEIGACLEHDRPGNPRQLEKGMSLPVLLSVFTAHGRPPKIKFIDLPD